MDMSDPDSPLTFKNGRQKKRRLFVVTGRRYAELRQCEPGATSCESCESDNMAESVLDTHWSTGARSAVLIIAVLLFPIVSPENCETGSRCTVT